MTSSTTEVQQKAWNNAQTLVSDFSESYAVITCKTDDDYSFAGGELKTLRRMRKELDDARKKVTVPLDTAKRAVMDQFKGADRPLAFIEDGLRKSMGQYTEEQRRKAAEAQAELDRKAREVAEAELLEEAEETGDESLLEEPVIEQRVQERRVNVSAAPPKVEGISKPIQDWKCEVTAPNLVPREYCMPNEPAIRAMVKAQNGNIKIPGVRIWPEDRIAVRG